MQKNLVFVIGLSPRLADPEVLKKNEYFGKYGRIYKVVINNHTVYNGAQVNLGERGGEGGGGRKERRGKNGRGGGWGRGGGENL